MAVRDWRSPVGCRAAPEAFPVAGLRAPRGTANLIRDAGQRDALYAAVLDYALERASAAAPRQQAEPQPGIQRRARPFDPDRRPGAAESRTGAIDREETLALQEKARHGHHVILARLYEWLWRIGWKDLEEIPAAIDLFGRRPDGARVIFEAKTITPTNETDQCRSAVAQLLEYRLEHGRPDDLICIAVDDDVSTRRVEILERLGIGLVMPEDRDICPLNAAGAGVVGSG